MVMHTLVPHQHHDDLSYEDNLIEHNSATSILDYLELAFHADLGEGHLEHLDSANGPELNQVLNTKVLVPIMNWHPILAPRLIEPNVEYVRVFTDNHRIPKDVSIQAPVLRGPPAFS